MMSGDYGVGSLVIFKREDDRMGILLKLTKCRYGGTPHWEIIMQDDGRLKRVLQTNLSNGRNRRYEIISSW